MGWRVELKKYWPEDWRAVHTLCSTETLEGYLGPELAAKVVITDGGDCGVVWGEERVEGCMPHGIVFCPGYCINEVVGALRDGLNGRPRKWVCVTDPNVWSEKVNKVKWPKGGCASKAH